MIAEQRSLIEDLAHSNQEYIRKFEELKLGIENTAVEHVDDASRVGALEREPSATTRSLPGATTGKFERMKFAVEGSPVQDKEHNRGLGSRELTSTRSSQKAQTNLSNSLADPPNANINNMFIRTNVQTNIEMPPVQERGIPTREAPIEFEQEALFKQLEHYSMLIKNLLKEVDEAQYKITFKSRLRVKGGIAGLHESERQELERIWGGTALQSAEQRLESLVEGLGELPMVNRLAAAARVPGPMFSSENMKRLVSYPPMAPIRELDDREQKSPVWLSQATPVEPLIRLDSVAGISTVEAPAKMPFSVNEDVAKESNIIGVSEDIKPLREKMTRGLGRDDSEAESKYHISDTRYIKPSDAVPRAWTDNSRSQKSAPSTPIVDAGTKPVGELTKNQMYMTTPGDMKTRASGRKTLKGLALSAARKWRAASASPAGDAQLSGPARRIVEGTYYPNVGKLGRRQSARAQYMEKDNDTALDEHFSQSQEDFTTERKHKVNSNRASTEERQSTAQTPNVQTVSPEDELMSASHSHTLSYPSVSVTSADDAPYMAHSTKASQLPREWFADDHDKWSSLFDPIEEKTGIGAVSHAAAVDQPSPRSSHQGSQSYTSDVTSMTTHEPLPTLLIEDPEDTVAVKRARNTMAARNSRKKKVEREEELVNQVAQLEAETEHWKNVVLSMGQRNADTNTEPQAEGEEEGASTEEWAAGTPIHPKPSLVSVSSLYESAGEQSQATLMQGTHAAMSNQLASLDAARDQPNFGPPSAMSPQNNERLSPPPTNQPPIPRPHQTLKPNRPLNTNTVSRPPEQQQNSPHVTPLYLHSMPSTTQEPIPLFPQSGSYSHPNILRPFLHGHQQQNPAVSGTTSRDGGVDVRIPILQIHVHPNLICTLLQESYSMPFNSELNNTDVRENSDYEQFLRNHALITEKHIQNQEVIFQCTRCPEKFTRYNLRSHLRTHTGGPPFPCTVCGEAFARVFDLKKHVAEHSGKEAHAGEHDPGSDIGPKVKPSPDLDLSSRLDDSLEWSRSMAEASGPTYPPYNSSPSALGRAESRETQVAACAAMSIQDPHIDLGIVDSVLERGQVEQWQPETEQGEWRLADMEVADRLVLLWTTVKPL